MQRRCSRSTHGSIRPFTTLVSASADTWEDITIFFRRFRVTGWRRGLVEIASEGFTFGAAGVVLMLMLAMPAFQETAGDWRTQDDFAVTFLDRQGNEIGQRGIIQRDSVPVDEMPDHVIKAVLATEDRRFFEHYGIDFLGLARAMSENMRANSVVQGGSSITQQLAKNLFLTNERTVERKIKEAFLAVWLEANLSKKEILQLYLDRAYMGGGTFGIAAAADFYFGKEVKDLNLAEAAMLAGLFKAPAKYAPHVNLPAARARANVVLTNLVESGFMTEGQVLTARLHPADVVDRGEAKTPGLLSSTGPSTRRSGSPPRPIQRSMVARTTFDTNIQRAAEESLEFNLRQHGKEYRVTEGAIVVLDTDGAVQGHRRRPRLWREPVQPRHQGAAPDRLVVQALCLCHGDGARLHAGIGHFRRADQLGRLVAEELWPQLFRPRDAGDRADQVDQHRAGAACQGPSFASRRSRRWLKRWASNSPLNGHKTMVLGTSGMTVMDQATGYSVFANGGFAGTRHGITQLATHSGEVFYDYRARRAQAEARAVGAGGKVDELDAGADPGDRHGAARRPARHPLRRQDRHHAILPRRLVCRLHRQLHRRRLARQRRLLAQQHMTGGSLPAMVWQRLMAYAHQDIDLKPIPGIENPFVDAEIAAKAGEAEKKRLAEAAVQEAQRPAELSRATTRLLLDMSETFHDARPLEQPPPKPAALSAL